MGLAPGILAFSLFLFSPTADAQEPAQQPAPALEKLRAGAANLAEPVPDQAERAALAAANSPALEHLRAADLHLTDHEVKIVAITAGVVLLLVILL